jgi:hypothetical protein
MGRENAQKEGSNTIYNFFVYLLFSLLTFFL